MTRPLHAAMLTDIAAASAEEIQFLEFQFSTNTTRLCTAANDVVWNGLTWDAIGGRLDMEGFSESAEDSQNGLRLTLCGIDLAFIAQVLGENFIGRPAKIWHGHIDRATGLIVGGATGPVLMFDGRMNETWEINETHGESGGGECSISTRVSARISEISKVRGIRTNVISHQSCGIAGVITDTFFQNVGSIPNVRDVGWGQPPRGGIPIYQQPPRERR